MSRDLKTFLVRLGALSAAACSSVYAVHSAPNDQAIATDRPLARSPYEVELVDETGRTLETYERSGRFYVLGGHGDRYSIRVRNPTGRRVEAVISVDGLDVIDGADADFKRKRGYIVPAYGELTVDGFRTSTTAVAAFRFSAVADSYAERKGKGRNVGVIGVAIFDEKGEPEMIMPTDEYGGGTYGGHYRDRYDAPSADTKGKASSSGGHASRRPAAPPPASSTPSGGVGAGTGAPVTAESAPAESSTAPRHFDGDDRGGESEMCCGPRPRPQSRPGLGTKWGEQRYSAVDFTRFVRASQTKPAAVAELRYNDSGGLRALGILVEPEPDGDELMRRETADPFPASGFASPPP